MAKKDTKPKGNHSNKTQQNTQNNIAYIGALIGIVAMLISIYTPLPLYIKVSITVCCIPFIWYVINLLIKSLNIMPKQWILARRKAIITTFCGIGVVILLFLFIQHLIRDPFEIFSADMNKTETLADMSVFEKKHKRTLAKLVKQRPKEHTQQKEIKNKALDLLLQVTVRRCVLAILDTQRNENKIFSHNTINKIYNDCLLACRQANIVKYYDEKNQDKFNKSVIDKIQRIINEEFGKEIIKD
ncbi:MAG: hypothetical protein LBJ63_01115 [Prevotellaceae bacterium]|jgi:hypothetical protein|nr:hypothetical protein [Prevotellaceae bacterium]